jgi:hypothetical protein
VPFCFFSFQRLKVARIVMLSAASALLANKAAATG